MKSKYFLITLGLIAIIGTSACLWPKPEELPVGIGDIIGYVNLYDDGTISLDDSGMKITVVGPDLEVFAITDSSGQFILSDVPFDSYSISYTKGQYGTYSDLLGHYNEVTETNTPPLGQLSNTSVTLVETSTTGNDVSTFVTSDPAGANDNTRYLRFFYHADANVSNANYTGFSSVIASNSNPMEHSLTKYELNSMGFASGSTVFVKVYGDSFYDNIYYDPSADIAIFPNLNMNTVDAISFIVP